MLVLTNMHDKETDLNESRKNKDLFLKKDEIIVIKESWSCGVMGTEARFRDVREKSARPGSRACQHICARDRND